MANQTMVFGAATRRSEKWRVYRIRTANSTYELEVQGEGERRCAVLTCVAPADRAGMSFEDSAPCAGAESLFALSPMEWMGRCLTLGTARTSEVQAVDFIATASSPKRARAPRDETLFGATPVQKQAPREEPRHQWAPFPHGQIEMTEFAACMLQMVCHHRDLMHALEGQPQLLKRMKLALAQCGLMLEAIEGRG